MEAWNLSDNYETVGLNPIYNNLRRRGRQKVQSTGGRRPTLWNAYGKVTLPLAARKKLASGDPSPIHCCKVWKQKVQQYAWFLLHLSSSWLKLGGSWTWRQGDCLNRSQMLWLLPTVSGKLGSRPNWKVVNIVIIISLGALVSKSCCLAYGVRSSKVRAAIVEFANKLNQDHYRINQKCFHRMGTRPGSTDTAYHTRQEESSFQVPFIYSLLLQDLGS